MSLDALLRADRAGLGRLLRAGQPLTPDELAGVAYHGLALCLPRWIQALTWRRFSKVFWRDDPDGPVRGWNVRVGPGGLDDPYVPLRTARGEPRTWGHFLVRPAEPSRPLLGCARGVVLDYGWGGRRRSPMGRVLDPLVAIEGPDLLLGCSVLDLGLTRLATPTYFLLRRAAAPEFVPPAPRDCLVTPPKIG